MPTLSLKLPRSLAAKLATAAKQTQRSKSEVARAALEAYLVNGHRRRVSALDLAGDFVGRFEGPGDLSYNKKYLEGLGR